MNIVDEFHAHRRRDGFLEPIGENDSTSHAKKRKEKARRIENVAVDLLLMHDSSPTRTGDAEPVLGTRAENHGARNKEARH